MQQLHNEEVLRKLGEDPNRLSRPAPPPAPPVTTAHDPANERH